MTKISVIVPFKAGGKKSRLSGRLSASKRREFALALLLDLFDVLKSAGLLNACIVVTSDPDAISRSTKAGARVATELKDQGVNSAVRRGMALSKGGDVLVLPSDLPLLKRGELRALLSYRSKGADVVLAPSSTFNGTNALLFRASLRFPLSYDDDSFWNHLASAARLGLTLAVYAGPGVLFDVDSPSELEALARSRSSRRAATFAREVATR